MQIFTYNKERFKEKGIEKEPIRALIHEHMANDLVRLKRNMSYYLGEHQIINRQRKTDDAPNNKPVCNHAKDIADTSTGFFLGSPIKYTSKKNEKDLDKITDILDEAEADETDQDNALDMARCGVGFEYIYVEEGSNKIKLKNLEPTNTFLVCDETIEQNPLFAVYYFVREESDTKKIHFKTVVATKEYIYDLVIQDTSGSQPLTEEPVEHHFGDIPIIQYLNNKDGIGDYEQQIGLIDAYNVLMADRVNDKEQFIDAILVIYGALLAEDETETSEAMKVLRKEKLLELPSDARAEYLARTFDESSVEVLRKAIKEDIYTFSHVPNLTDENFVGNSSGVAMEYKLLGLMMITNTKERYYRKGLKKRLQLIANYCNIRAIGFSAGEIIPKFTHTLPKNRLEISQMISNLKDVVSQKTLVSQLDFVEDPDGEIKAVMKEKKEALKNQKDMFSIVPNTRPYETSEDDEALDEE